MEIVAKDLRNTPGEKRQRRLLLTALWIGGIVTLVMTSFVNWGVLAVAALLTLVALFARAKPHRICLDPESLSIRQGEALLWSTSREELKRLELANASKWFGITQSPKRIIFTKRDGDLFSLPLNSFEEAEIEALILKLDERETTL